MGGNVSINGKEPQPLSATYRLPIREIVEDVIGTDYVAASGSTTHLLDRDISIDVLDGYEFSDVDMMVDETKKEAVLRKVENAQYPVERDWCIIHGYKKHGTQVSLVIEAKNELNQCFQLDIEFKPFKDGQPTEWAKLSQSSPKEDFLAGIKGVYHKQMIMALTAYDYLVGEFKNSRKTAIEEHPRHKFSVAYGLRKNVERTEDHLFRLIKPAEAKYLQDPDVIARVLLQIDDFWLENPGQHIQSLHNICRYMNDNFLDDDIQLVVDDFYDRLLGEKNRVNRPEAEKQKVIETVCQLIPNLPTSPFVQQSAQDDSQGQP